jgi:hypothetical protein
MRIRDVYERMDEIHRRYAGVEPGETYTLPSIPPERYRKIIRIYAPIAKIMKQIHRMMTAYAVARAPSTLEARVMDLGLSKRAEEVVELLLERYRLAHEHALEQFEAMDEEEDSGNKQDE